MMFAWIKRKKWLILIFLVCALVVFFVARGFLKKKKDVEVAKVEKGTVTEELILSGEIKADEYANLKFSSSGEVAWMGVEEGDWVKKGQALAKLDMANLVSDLQRANADLREAEATVDKVHDDVKGHDADETLTQRETRTEAEVAKDKAWENVLKARENLRNATLYAPFAGLIASVANPFGGINILYTEAAVEIINPETIYFEVTADQSELANLSVGQAVTIVLDTYPDEEIEAEISFIGYTPQSVEAGAVYKVKVVFNNLETDATRFRYGMTGDAKFILSQKEDVLWVPPDFINSDNKGKFVYLGVKNRKRYIEIGLEGEERVEIQGDIKEGDQVYD